MQELILIFLPLGSQQSGRCVNKSSLPAYHSFATNRDLITLKYGELLFLKRLVCVRKPEVNFRIGTFVVKPAAVLRGNATART